MFLKISDDVFVNLNLVAKIARMDGDGKVSFTFYNSDAKHLGQTDWESEDSVYNSAVVAAIHAIGVGSLPS